MLLSFKKMAIIFSVATMLANQKSSCTCVPERFSKGDVSMFKILLAMIAMASIGLSSPLTQKQAQTLELVYEIARKYPDKTGETFEKTVMAICLTETSASVHRIGDLGKNPNVFTASLGIMQVRLETARFIAKKLHREDVLAMDDTVLVQKLLSDDIFNATIAIQYFVWLRNHTGSYFRAVSRYNGGNKNTAYYNRVMRNMRNVERWLGAPAEGGEYVFFGEAKKAGESPRFEKNIQKTSRSSR